MTTLNRENIGRPGVVPSHPSVKTTYACSAWLWSLFDDWSCLQHCKTALSSRALGRSPNTSTLINKFGRKMAPPGINYLEGFMFKISLGGFGEYLFLALFDQHFRTVYFTNVKTTYLLLKGILCSFILQILTGTGTVLFLRIYLFSQKICGVS